MGQYYVAVILAEDGTYIRSWLSPHRYNNGAKLMEHSYLMNSFLDAIEILLGSRGIFYKSRLVWAGDYADPEPSSENLYTLANNIEDKHFIPTPSEMKYRYIVNHTKKQYIDKMSLTNLIHPLPLLVSEGNGRGGGDYDGPNKHLCGTWARDVISMNDSVVDGFEEFRPDFYR